MSEQQRVVQLKADLQEAAANAEVLYQRILPDGQSLSSAAQIVCAAAKQKKLSLMASQTNLKRWAAYDAKSCCMAKLIVNLLLAASSWGSVVARLFENKWEHYQNEQAKCMTQVLQGKIDKAVLELNENRTQLSAERERAEAAEQHVRAVQRQLTEHQQDTERLAKQKEDIDAELTAQACSPRSVLSSTAHACVLCRTTADSAQLGALLGS